MKNKMNVNPLEGNILKGMLIFAFPVALSCLMTMLFSCIDTIVIGRFGHENAIAAIGVSSSVINLLVGGLTGLGGGIVVAAGHYYGRGDKQKIKNLLHSIPLTALFLGGILSICTIALAVPILRLLSCPEQLMAAALTYFRIYFLGVPFTVLGTFLSSIIQAKGNSYVPFSFQILASVTNIVLDLFFVIGLDLNLVGVAAATVIAQVLLSLLLLFYLCRQKDELQLDVKKLKFFTHMNDVFSIGIPSSLEGIAINLSGAIISSAINKFDANVIAGNSISTTIEGLMVVTFTGFAGASAVYVSQNYGSGNLKRVKESVIITVITVFLSAEVIGGILYLLSPKLLLIFTTDLMIIQNACLRMRYMCLFFGLCGVMNVIGDCIRGLGDARTPLIISILCSIVFRLTWIFTYAKWKGTISAIYLSYPICWGLCCFMNIVAFIIVFNKKMRQK